MSTPDTFFFSSNALNLDKIKELKELLVSTDDGERHYAVEVLDAYASGDELNIVMKSDIVTMLCDTIAFGNYTLNSLIYHVLSKMCRQERFFTDDHASIVGMTVCRSLKFMVKEPVHSSELESALYLIADIIKGYNQLDISPERGFLEHVNDIVQSLTTGTEGSPKITLAIATILSAFLSMNVLKIKESTGRILFENLKRCFGALAGLCRQNSVDLLVDRALDASSNLSPSICRFLSSCDGSQHPFVTAEEQADLLQIVSVYAVTVGLPYVMKLPTQEIIALPEKVTSLFQCFSLLLQEVVTGENRALAHSLCESGVLPFITQILPLADERFSKSLRLTSLELLSTILVTLSLDLFTFPGMWSEGEDHFRREVSNGIESLPLDPQYWLHSLCDPSQNRPVVLVILLYLFFSVLVEGKFKDNDTFIAVSEFLDNVNGLGSCPLMLKIVWLVLALSQVNVPDDELADGFELAVIKLVGFLQDQNDLQLVYTHHPGLLYHAFHYEQFPHSLLLQLVQFWLQNESEIGDSLTELLKTSERARFAILDLILTVEDPILTSAHNAYSPILATENSDDQAATVWHLLPNALSKLCGNAIAVHNVNRLAELALIRVPQLWDPLELSRCAGLVPASIATLDTVPLSLWSLAHLILAEHIGQSDFRVVTYYMRSNGFSEKLLENIGKQEIPEVTQISLRIATILNLIQRKERHIPVLKCDVLLDPERILVLLQSQDPETRHRALLFIHELLESHWDPHICRLGGPPTPNFIRNLFSLLQDYCVQESSDELWECLGSCLRLFPVDHPVTNHLVNNPWLPHLFEVSLPLLCQQPAMVTFIEDWLLLHQPQRLSSRRISNPIYVTTLALISEELQRNTTPEASNLLQKITEIRMEKVNLTNSVVKENPPKRHVGPPATEPSIRTCLNVGEPAIVGTQTPDLLAPENGPAFLEADLLGPPPNVEPPRSPVFNFLTRANQNLTSKKKSPSFPKSSWFPSCTKRKSSQGVGSDSDEVPSLWPIG